MGILDKFRELAGLKTETLSCEELRQKARKPPVHHTCSSCSRDAIAEASNLFNVSCSECQRPVCDICSGQRGAGPRTCGDCKRRLREKEEDSRRCTFCNAVVFVGPDGNPYTGNGDLGCHKCKMPVCTACATTTSANEKVTKICPQCA